MFEENNHRISIRHAAADDLECITALESACFPPADAADRESFRARLSVYPDYFWLLEEDGKVVAMINGLVTDIPVLQDIMFEDAGIHKADGAWQMIFGVATNPDYQGKGYASMIMERVIADAGAQGRKGIVLTCKDKLLPFYERFGFVNEGVSKSEHGGAVWYDMRLTF